MRKITIIYDGSVYTYRWVKALIWAKDEFKQLGYKVEFANFLDYFPIPFQKSNIFENIRLALSLTGKFDIVFLAFHHSSTNIGRCEKKRIKLVKKIKEKCNLLCWFDTADSTGSCLFDVLPFVDLYFKKQILKDASLYTKEFYCGRPYCQYYHEKFGLIDESLDKTKFPVADENHLNKLRISWNVAFYDRLGSKWRIYFHPFDIAEPKFIDDNIKKVIDVHFGGSNPEVYGTVVGYQRKKILEIISSLKSISHPDVYKKIPRKEYLSELKYSRSIASPFGWGECCLRDFEAFTNNAILLKPSMEHCETYPSFYKPYETYVPISWDFSDFSEILHKVNSDQFKRIAENGKLYYLEYRIGNSAKIHFANHLISEIERK